MNGRRFVADPEANRQILKIASLALQGLSDEEIARTMARDGEEGLKAGDTRWYPHDVLMIREAHRIPPLPDEEGWKRLIGGHWG